MSQHACSPMGCVARVGLTDFFTSEQTLLGRSEIAILVKAKQARARLRKTLISSAEM